MSTSTNKILFKTVMNNLKPMGNPDSGKCTVSMPIELLWPDPAYQRIDIRSGAKIRKLIQNWNENKLLPIVVVPHPEENRFALVDGYGRYIAASSLPEPYTSLDAIVLTHVPSDPMERQKFEAEIFCSQDDEIEPVKAVQKHKARVLLGDVAACSVDHLCNQYHIDFVTKPGSRDKAVLGSYNEAYRIAQIHGEPCLDFIFRTVKSLGWLEEKNGLATYVLRAFRHMYAAHRNQGNAVSSYIIYCLRKTEPGKFKARAVARYPERDLVAACTLWLEDEICQYFKIDRQIYDDGKSFKYAG